MEKFLTNSKHLQEQINHSENVKNDDAIPGEPTCSRITLGISQMPRCDEYKVLGISWNLDSDQLIIDITSLAHLAQSLRPTKRGLIGLIGRFYDPLGYLSLVIIRFKLILQERYKNKADWDEIIPDELLKKWRILMTDLSDATQIHLSRCYFGDVMDCLN